MPIEQRKQKFVFKTAYYRVLAGCTLLTVPLLKIIIISTVHTNKTPEHYMFVYFIVIIIIIIITFYSMYRSFIRPSSGTERKYVLESYTMESPSFHNQSYKLH
jgi:hypothetical protein